MHIAVAAIADDYCTPQLFTLLYASLVQLNFSKHYMCIGAMVISLWCSKNQKTSLITSIV